MVSNEFGIPPGGHGKEHGESKNEKDAGEAVLVAVVSGFSGAGKSSLIESVRAQMRSKKISVICDDGVKNLTTEIEKLIALESPHAILIESMASGEPFGLAEYLSYGDDDSLPPAGIRLDTMVTVVDATNFLDECMRSDDLSDRGLGLHPSDERTVAEVLIEQVEYADVIVVNKIDVVNDDELSRLEALLFRLNPGAMLIRAQNGRVVPDAVVGTGLFDFDETGENAGWLAELAGDFIEMADKYGISSFTYMERRPFHPIRFQELLADFEIEGLIRARGSLWIATRHHEIGLWSLAGSSSILGYGGAWLASTPAREWPRDERVRAEIMTDWVPPFGDRRQEIAFIGVNMNHDQIIERLNECLLTANEMKDGPDSWDSIPDPLPDWHVGGDEDERIGPEYYT